MKTLVLIAVLVSSIAAHAQDQARSDFEKEIPNPNRELDYTNTNCKDSNLNGLGQGSHDQLQYHKRFKKLYSGNSPAPAGIDPLVMDGQICFATTATYFKHKSGATYVMYTTGDDYCDGGNTIGVMLDTEVYRDKQSIEKSIVAEINDGEFSCVKK